MDEKNLIFFAMRVNDMDAALFVTADEAIEALCDHLAVNKEDAYTIEPVDGIYELVRRMGAFESFDDEWMEEVLAVTTGMVAEAKRIRAKDGSHKDEDESNEY